MKIIPLSNLEVRKRQREKIDSAALTELKESILSPKGLLHPPVAYLDAQTNTYVLVCGERRLRAIQTIHKEKNVFTFEGLPVPFDHIPISELSDLSPSDLLEAELEENIIRVDLPWQDRIRALAALHKQRQSENPEQTKSDTANELSAKTGVPNRSVRRHLSQALIISEKLDDPKISKARNAAEAQALILKSEEERLMSTLTRRKLSKSDAAADIQLRRGDLFTLLPSLPEGFVDLVLSDPPYGIGVGSAGFRGRTVHHHNYEDDEQTASKIAQALLEDGFRLCKARANLFMFCDIKRWYEFRTLGSRMGWEVFPRPIIWQKSESEGLAPWGRQGFRITYDAILYATKGGRGLITSPVDILTVKRVPRNLRLHAAEKPVELLRLLIECSTLAGDFVLDPCCGSGSTLVAAKELGRKGLGIELDEATYNTAMANVFKGEEGEEGCNPELNSSESQESSSSSTRKSSEDGCGTLEGSDPTSISG